MISMERGDLKCMSKIVPKIPLYKKKLPTFRSLEARVVGGPLKSDLRGEESGIVLEMEEVGHGITCKAYVFPCFRA